MQNFWGQTRCIMGDAQMANIVLIYYGATFFFIDTSIQPNV